jgi:hypothetical protein
LNRHNIVLHTLNLRWHRQNTSPLRKVSSEDFEWSYARKINFWPAELVDDWINGLTLPLPCAISLDRSAGHRLGSFQMRLGPRICFLPEAEGGCAQGPCHGNFCQSGSLRKYQFAAAGLRDTQPRSVESGYYHPFCPLDFHVQAVNN